MKKLIRLHRRTESLMTLAAVVAFISGAGLDAPTVLPALIVLVLVTVWDPSSSLRRRVDPLWKVLAVLLAIRAAYHVVVSPEDIVLPMVDLLLVLLLGEIFRVRDSGNDARVYALTFALLVASAAYRPGALFAIAFILYMAAATVSLMVGHLLQKVERQPAHDVTLRPRFLAQSAAFSGVALITSAVVFLAFPRVTRGWVSRGLPLAQTVMGFSNRVSLTEHGGRLYPNPELVLRVEFPDSVPSNMNALHWRGLSFDRFDGFDWLRSPGLYQPRGPDEDIQPRNVIAQHVFGADLPELSVLFGLHHIMVINGDDYRFSPHRQPNGDYNYAGPSPPSYTVYSNTAVPSPEALARDSGAVTMPLAPYLQVPPMSDRMRALADSLARGTVTISDRVNAVQRYLSTFSYTLELPATSRETSLDYFLFTRRKGHCEYFSTAMAVLLRAMGVPTRNVNGFLGGEWNSFGKFLNVTQNQAHSWVEVWYPRYGWIEYDPTPASLSGVAEDDASWLKPLRSLFDGLDYRWNRWVLEYDMKAQLSMFSRVTDAFRRSPSQSSTSRSGGIMRWVMLVAVLILAIGALTRVRLPGGKTDGPATAAYLRLRRAYEKRGYPAAPVMPPLEFAELITRRNEAGASDALHAIQLYLRARFSNTALPATERAELVAATKRAREALKNG